MKTQEIQYAFGKSTFGLVLTAKSDKGLCAIFIGDDRGALLRELHDRFSEATITEGNATLAAKGVKLVENPWRASDEPLDPCGTKFQLSVWNALRKIPAGSTVSYADIARRIGRPKAVRAVGTACGANPLAVIIPCHRVLAKDGKLTGYRWGMERKRKLLEMEKGEAT